MASRRMLAKQILDSDAFKMMDLGSQALYVHLNLQADDEGFVNSPKSIQRSVGATNDNMKELIETGFIIPFESGVIVIKHWKMHNCIRADRKKHTAYTEEKAMLVEKENGSYTLAKFVPMADECLTDGSQMSAQTSIDKISIDKISIEETSKEETRSLIELLKPFKLKKEHMSVINDFCIEYGEDAVKEAVCICLENGQCKLAYLGGVLRNKYA